jgi:hypothetical protein
LTAAAFDSEEAPRKARKPRREEPMLLTMSVIVLILALLGSLPTWPHARNWGYYPGGGISLVLFVLLIVFIIGR